jgi:hypothetical protein
MGHEKLHKRETFKVNPAVRNHSNLTHSRPELLLRNGAIPVGSPKASLSNDDLLDYYLGFQ